MYLDYFFGVLGLHLASLDTLGKPRRHKSTHYGFGPKDAQRDAHGAHKAALKPEEVAKSKKSYTGKFLKALLEEEQGVKNKETKEGNKKQVASSK